MLLIFMLFAVVLIGAGGPEKPYGPAALQALAASPEVVAFRLFWGSRQDTRFGKVPDTDSRYREMDVTWLSATSKDGNQATCLVHESKCFLGEYAHPHQSLKLGDPKEAVPGWMAPLSQNAWDWRSDAWPDAHPRKLVFLRRDNTSATWLAMRAAGRWKALDKPVDATVTEGSGDAFESHDRRTEARLIDVGGGAWVVSLRLRAWQMATPYMPGHLLDRTQLVAAFEDDAGLKSALVSKSFSWDPHFHGPLIQTTDTGFAVASSVTCTNDPVVRDLAGGWTVAGQDVTRTDARDLPPCPEGVLAKPRSVPLTGREKQRLCGDSKDCEAFDAGFGGHGYRQFVLTGQRPCVDDVLVTERSDPDGNVVLERTPLGGPACEGATSSVGDNKWTWKSTQVDGAVETTRKTTITLGPMRLRHDELKRTLPDGSEIRSRSSTGLDNDYSASCGGVEVTGRLLPRVKVDPSLWHMDPGSCGTRVFDEGGVLSVLLASETELWVQVFDVERPPLSANLPTGDHLKIWTAKEAGRCKDPGKPWIVRLNDAKVFPEQADAPTVTQHVDETRRWLRIRLPYAPEHLTVAFIDVDDPNNAPRTVSTGGHALAVANIRDDTVLGACLPKEDEDGYLYLSRGQPVRPDLRAPGGVPAHVPPFR